MDNSSDEAIEQARALLASTQSEQEPDAPPLDAAGLQRLRLFLAAHPAAFVMDVMAEFDLTESEARVALRRGIALLNEQEA